MDRNDVKSAAHNLGVVAVGFAVAGAGLALDRRIGRRSFRNGFSAAAGVALIAGGFLLRWSATRLFYREEMRVISLEPQQALITTGPFRYTRNPLYLGGNGFVFLGAALVAGSPGAVILTGVGLLATDRMIQREEQQLEATFGDEWRQYKERVPRWF